jgi:hypothetical protein
MRDSAEALILLPFPEYLFVECPFGALILVVACALSREGAGMKVKKVTLEFLERNFDCNLIMGEASFTSQTQYNSWLKQIGGFLLAEVSLEPVIRPKFNYLLALNEAKDAANDTSSCLVLESLTKPISIEDVIKFKSAIRNRARDKVVQTPVTLSICSNESVIGSYGDLQLVNHGEGVVFYSMDDENAYLKCDGLIKAACGALLVNHVRTSPTEMDMDYVLFRALQLRLILEYPSLFKSVPSPHSALQELNGAKRVVPFLSGSDFPSALVQICRERGINAVETSFSDWSVRIHFSPGV